MSNYTTGVSSMDALEVMYGQPSNRLEQATWESEAGIGRGASSRCVNDWIGVLSVLFVENRPRRRPAGEKSVGLTYDQLNGVLHTLIAARVRNRRNELRIIELKRQLRKCDERIAELQNTTEETNANDSTSR